MTSTRSAADTGLPSNRRSFVTSLTAAALLPGTALASAAPPADEPHPDADLFKLEELLTAADIRRRELGRLCEDVVEPPIPANLLCMSNDWIFIDPAQCLEFAQGPHGKARLTYATDGVVETLRGKIEEWNAWPAKTKLLCGIERRISRAEEIIAGVEAWEADRRAAEAASGVGAAQEAYDAQECLVDNLFQRIAATPAHTDAGACVKLRAELADIHGDRSVATRARQGMQGRRGMVRHGPGWIDG